MLSHNSDYNRVTKFRDFYLMELACIYFRSDDAENQSHEDDFNRGYLGRRPDKPRKQNIQEVCPGLLERSLSEAGYLLFFFLAARGF